MKTLIIFTSSYPYEGALEHTFLEPELEYLCLSFEQVILVPAQLIGEKRSLSAVVKVEESYAEFMNSKNNNLAGLVSVLATSFIWVELLAQARHMIHIRTFKNLLYLTRDVRKTKNWLLKFITDYNIDLNYSVFYTYWFDKQASGICLAKKDKSDIKVITRAHRFDLYEEMRTPPLIFFRSQCLKLLDKVYVVSRDGRNYLAGKYPQHDKLYEVKRLGVKSPDFLTPRSEDGIFRIVSCSLMVPVKRIELIWKGICVLAALKSTERFEWYHIGDGPLMNEIIELARASPSNLECKFIGNLSNDQVLQFYHNNNIDVFVNTSESEGIPVSIMEAQSCGIPVVATKVGGNSEIVSEENGMIINAYPSPSEISDAIWEVVHCANINLKRRQKSFENWKFNFNADHNYKEFSDNLSLLAS